jgi:hypothetical protein
MELLDRLFDIARRRNRKIVLPEGDDARIVAAAARIIDQNLGRPICSALPPLSPRSRTNPMSHWTESKSWIREVTHGYKTMAQRLRMHAHR